MKNIKYPILGLLALAAFLTGCQKTGSNEPFTLTLRATLGNPSATDPGTRVALGDDGLACKWIGNEYITLFSDSGEDDYIFSIASVSSDRRTAEFTYAWPSTPIPAGSYRVAAESLNRIYDGSGDLQIYYPTRYVNQMDQHGLGVLSGESFIGAQKVTVPQGAAALGEIELVPAGALLEIPVKNSTGAPVAVDSLNVSSDQSFLYRRLWHSDGSFSDQDYRERELTVKIKDPDNTIAPGETYRVYKIVMPQTISSEVTFKIITADKKEYSFTRPGKTLEAGLRYTVQGIELVTPDVP